MAKFIIRLDDACPKINQDNWRRIEDLCDKYDIRPLVGVIPECLDPDFSEFPEDTFFWTDTVKRWINKKWTLALHGLHHIFNTCSGGINPVNNKSEFAGLPYKEQLKMIKDGVRILKLKGIEPKVFFAPAHTFDLNTLQALKDGSEIRIISDTPANNIYRKNDFTFVPQQSGKAMKLPFKISTFCYHPNTMSDIEFKKLELFLLKNKRKFIDFPLAEEKRPMGFIDKAVNKMYFLRRKGKHL